MYYPNDENTFISVVINKNHYEWRKIAKSRLVRKKYGIIIYFRDIYKQWYVKGINSKTDGIMPLVKLVQELTNGYEVTTCGNSAGGYMAVLIGCLIAAEKCLNFSGQYNLNIVEDAGPYVDEQVKGKGEFLEITRFIEDNKIPVFYFFPGHCEDDINQYNCIKTKSIYSFKFDESNHGASMYSICFPYIIGMNSVELKRLYYVFENKVIDKGQFSREIVPRFTYFLFCIKNRIKKSWRTVKKKAFA